MAIEKGTKNAKKNDPTPSPTSTPANAVSAASTPTPTPESSTPASPGKRRGAPTGARTQPTMKWTDKDNTRKKAILLALREMQTEPVHAVTVDRLVAKLAEREEFQVPAKLKGEETEIPLADLLTPANVRAQVRKLEQDYWLQGLDMYAPKDETVTKHFIEIWESIKGERTLVALEPAAEGAEGAVAHELRGRGFPKLAISRKSSGVGLGFDLSEI